MPDKEISKLLEPHPHQPAKAWFRGREVKQGFAQLSIAHIIIKVIPRQL
jgi:hypothetical protein